MMESIDRRDIYNLFVQAFADKDMEIVSGLNPCIIRYKGVRYNVYIKKLTPAQLSNNNENVWRCQLPKRPIFDDFKASPDMFLLLGYDVFNDVYATWNHYWVKQRLNVGESVSMYSRYSIQEKAKDDQEIIRHDLNHNGVVVVFPRTLLPYYLDNVSNFFAEETEYKAIGSSLRKTQNTMTDKSRELFSFFNNPERVESLKSYLAPMLLKPSTKNRYARAVDYLYKNDLFLRHKEIFIKCQRFEEYEQAINEFYKSEDISYIDRRDGGRHGDVRAALKLFYKSLLGSWPKEQNGQKDVSIPKIFTQELIEKITPVMCQEEPNIIAAMQILSDYYGDSYNETMKLNDWMELLHKVDWNSLKNNMSEE